MRVVKVVILVLMMVCLQGFCFGISNAADSNLNKYTQ